MDVHTKERRSYNMSRIRAKNTKPEVALRRMLSAQGIRGYRLHTTLPGKPDIVFSKIRLAIFMDGCFWHGCEKCCNRVIGTNQPYWSDKILKNKERDIRQQAALKKLGWKVMRIWEHELENEPDKCLRKILKLLIARQKDLRSI